LITVFSSEHRRQAGTVELINGRLQPPVEKPARADTILAAVESAQLGRIVAPKEFGVGPIERVHDPRLVAFIASAWDEWVAAHGEWDALPLCFMTRSMREREGMEDREPETIDGRLGYFAFDAGTPIVAGTWSAARSAVDVALTGLELLSSGERAVFSLCRPPGHHAAREYYGGYCFFNNAAIATQKAIDSGARRVAILDVDYHHGNGTQSIFYERSDVLFVSIHADPGQDYPYFLGYADEVGRNAGEGYNVNLPLRWGADWTVYEVALQRAVERIRRHEPELLVVSLGLDTFEKDPISRFQLKTGDYPNIGRYIASIATPTLFVMEGGYAVEELGLNTVSVLRGFESA
jgi:acetoin utilization deacetylase AcuC-like enzyme